MLWRDDLRVVPLILLLVLINIARIYIELNIRDICVIRGQMYFVNCIGSLVPPFGILRKIVCDRVPRSAAIDKGMKLRSNPGVIVESSHTNRYLRTIRPIAAK